MIGLLGKKVGMTQLYDDQGRQVPVTVVEVGPCYVTDLKTKERNGYQSVQLGFDKAKEKRTTKARLGHLKKASAPAVRFIREIRTENLEGLTVGAIVGAENFEEGDIVDVEGISIGRGFQGVVKRHHFKGGEKSHGSMFGRVPGSIGASSFPSRVVKGMRAAGHMGDHRTTLQNLKVVKVDKENQLLAIHGSVPGAEGAYLVVRAALKKKQQPRKWKVQGGQDLPAKTATPEQTQAEGAEKQPEDKA